MMLMLMLQDGFHRTRTLSCCCRTRVKQAIHICRMERDENMKMTLTRSGHTKHEQAE